MKMSPCKVHLGMFQYCLNITKLLNSGFNRAPRSAGVRACLGKGWAQNPPHLQTEGKPAVKTITIIIIISA